jgi:16S rRNA (adenine1518-N6/adenine1519-N6)-dimethyltransferase
MYTLKKSLGQHFLVDENISRKIVDTVRDLGMDQVLEVGPGGGAITKYLAEIPGVKFRAVELDNEKVDYLVKAYPGLQGRIIHQDFLQMEKPFEGEFLVIGNFPYNISSQILFKILEWKESVPFIVGMFQKEMALRVAAKEGSKVYGVISVLVQAFYSVNYLFDVSENSFNPPPKVKSGVIFLQRKEQPIEMRSDKDLFTLVKAAFNQRRKTLRNATRSLFDTSILEDELFDKRAEQLPVEQFGRLSFKMK